MANETQRGSGPFATSGFGTNSGADGADDTEDRSADKAKVRAALAKVKGRDAELLKRLAK